VAASRHGLASTKGNEKTTWTFLACCWLCTEGGNNIRKPGLGLLTWHLRPAGWLPPEGQGGDLQQDVYGVSHTPCESCMLFFPRRGGPHCLTQQRRAYRTCTAPVARVGLAEPLTPLFSSARTGLPAQQGYTSNMMAIRSRATSREKAELPPAGRPGIAAGPPAEPGLGPEPGGGAGAAGPPA
jgi:hypothetical protein